MAVPSLSEVQFRGRMQAHGIFGPKTIKALYWHLVKGRPKVDAARLAGIDASAVTRGLARMTRPTCPSCGQELPPDLSAIPTRKKRKTAP